MLAAIEGPASTTNTNVIAAGLSLLLGPEGRAQQQRQAVVVSRTGATPLVVALLAPRGDDVETLVAVAPRVLN